MRGIDLGVLGAILLGAASLGASCGQSALALMPGVVNDPGNRSLRKAIFGFAESRLCAEMRARSLPLALDDGDPGVGRFYPTACAVSELGNEDLFVQFVGHGYAWTNVTGRMGFEAAAAVEYDHDFLVSGSSLYVYFKQVRTQSSSFNPLMVERPSAGGVAAGAVALLGADFKAVTQQIGSRVLQAEIARGFSVVRDGDGAVAFSLGVLEKGQHPLAPFAKGSSDWAILADDRSELHSGQRDYIGPLELADSKHALVLSVAVEGAPSVEVSVVPQSTGDTWIAQYERYAQTGPPPSPALLHETVNAAAAGSPPLTWRRRLPLAPGRYYIVLDNATRGAPLDDRAALVSYAVQLAGG